MGALKQGSCRCSVSKASTQRISTDYVHSYITIALVCSASYRGMCTYQTLAQLSFNDLLCFQYNAFELLSKLHIHYHMSRLQNGHVFRKSLMCKQLYKLVNSETMTEDWVALNFQQQFNGRSHKFQFYTSYNYKVGQNLMVNRFRQLNNKIDYNWLNESFSSQKIKCKKLFLQ